MARINKSSMFKKDFNKKQLYGINSFKLENGNRELRSLIEQLNKECVDLLSNGSDSTNNKKDGLTITVEAPKCCRNYCSFNIDRKVPLRQYFGEVLNNDTNKGISQRYSYGVGSGSTTVGGDVTTTTTKPLTTVMKKLCRELEKLSYVRNLKVSVGNQRVRFNHVTILYYLMDNDTHQKVTLRPHCDLEVTATNKVKKGNSQVEGSPTLVLALQKSKNITFYKRYSDGMKFYNECQEVDSMTMNHGDIFFLHPKDERVLKRRILEEDDMRYCNEDKKSQFKHGVVCSFEDLDHHRNKSKNERTKQQVSISVCFRQTNTIKFYSSKNHTLIDQNGCIVDNDRSTKEMEERALKIATKRKEYGNENNVERMEKKGRNFANSCKVIKSNRHHKKESDDNKNKM